ncbi:MAG: hypothetical protein IKF52_02030 [Clostridia bacterium]|nr:hypothetical protein [Clostridia bacterium]
MKFAIVFVKRGLYAITEKRYVDSEVKMPYLVYGYIEVVNSGKLGGVVNINVDCSRVGSEELDRLNKEAIVDFTNR